MASIQSLILSLTKFCGGDYFAACVLFPILFFTTFRSGVHLGAFHAQFDFVMRRVGYGLCTVASFVILHVTWRLFVAFIQFLVLPFAEFHGGDYFAACILCPFLSFTTFRGGCHFEACHTLSFTIFRGGDCFVASVQFLRFQFAAFRGDDYCVASVPYSF